MTNFIHQYVRDKKNNPIGLLTAHKLENGTVVITGSKVNTKRGDVFNKTVAFKIANDRMYHALNGREEKNYIAQNMRYDMIRFIDRVQRYFQVTEDCIIIPTVREVNSDLW